MKVPINLASQPFRRDRAMIAASAAVCVLLCVTLAILISLAMTDRAQVADVRVDINRLNGQLRRLASQQAQMDDVLRKPENAEVLERSLFINTLLTRKAISWTRIFADLEKKVPYNVRIVQIHPVVDQDEHILLDMMVASDSPAAIVELSKKLEDAPFSRPVPKLLQPPSQAEPFFKYRVSVQYAQKL